MTNEQIAGKLNHNIAMYGHTDSKTDREYLARIFYYAGLLAGQFQTKDN